ncbi:MAG: DHA2 family efflux MFS transporter permease subunit [Gammaproteobacteria bacterium]|nr:DHA2 family efflux MFS transporter permease subunit [Gammaproteobacteria bacterium]
MKGEVQRSHTTLSQWLSFIAVVLASAVYASAWTLPNAVLPQIQGGLSVSMDEVSWAVTASVVAGAIGIPLTPWLSQRFGAKRLMMATLGTFSTASAMVGTVSTFEELIIWRVIAAFAGAPILALSQSVILETFEVSKRSLAFSLWSIGITSGWVFSPAVGAWLADLVSWRLAFFSIVPFGFIAFFFCSIFMTPSLAQRPARFDWTGFLTLVIALTMIQLLVNRGHRLDWFHSTTIITFSVVGLAAFYLYVIHTLHCRTPFLNWAVFRDRNLVIGLCITLIYAAIGLIPMVLLPMMLTQLRGVEVITLGVLSIPRGVAQIIGLIFAGLLVNRIDPRYLLISGLVVFSASSWYMAHYNMNIGVWDIFWPTVSQGLSLAFIWIPLLALIYATIDPLLRTYAATLLSLTYSLSSSLGVALAVTILSRSMQINHEEIGALMVPLRKVFHFENGFDYWHFDSLTSLLLIEHEMTLQAYTLGYGNVFFALVICSLVPIPFVMLMKR